MWVCLASAGSSSTSTGNDTNMTRHRRQAIITPMLELHTCSKTSDFCRTSRLFPLLPHMTNPSYAVLPQHGFPYVSEPTFLAKMAESWECCVGAQHIWRTKTGKGGICKREHPNSQSCFKITPLPSCSMLSIINNSTAPNRGEKPEEKGQGS